MSKIIGMLGCVCFLGFGALLATAQETPNGPRRVEVATLTVAPESTTSSAVVSPSILRSDTIRIDLRQLQDAYGLALLVEDDSASRMISEVWKRWDQEYSKKLKEDSVVKAIDAQMSGLFQESIKDRVRPVREFQHILLSVPVDKVKEMLTKWLQMFFYEQGILFPQDLAVQGEGRLQFLCEQAHALAALKGLSGLQARSIVWRYRDNEVRRLFAQRDERVASLTPIVISKKELPAETARILSRYLAMLITLKLQVEADKQLPFDKFRTLTGLLRGLRYMDTIRYASEVTGTDHYLMTRLFIQESDFVHERVSPAGAFSVAQFMRGALKDVWTFRNAIPGGSVLLKDVKDPEDLRKKIVKDPRMAIKAACIYMRRLHKEVAMRMDKEGHKSESDLATLLSLDLYALPNGLANRSMVDTLLEISQDWPIKNLVLLPFMPITGGMVPDSNGVLAQWMEKAVQSMLHVQISKTVFKQRMEFLQSTLALAAYNAGIGSLIKSARKQAPYDSMGIPVQMNDTRNYADDILDGVEVLAQVRQFSSGVFHLDWDELMKLIDKACHKARRS